MGTTILKGSAYFCMMGHKLTEDPSDSDCVRHFKAILDTQYILNGKWKVIIIAMLAQGKRRYLELQRMLEGIGSKMLSKELQHLEINGIVLRTVVRTKPVSVEYELTAYGKTLKPLTDEMARWGLAHKNHLQHEVKGVDNKYKY
ncbi:winged helix-turn-helix transcriptional regulator [Pedobacter fastidiosus]|nr:helix-turn-helix domain-containing protein [Pedobacter fastidiosus]